MNDQPLSRRQFIGGTVAATATGAILGALSSAAAAGTIQVLRIFGSPSSVRARARYGRAPVTASMRRAIAP